jgi:hypothetical protein
MSNERNPESAKDQPMVYQIRLEGYLGDQWADWFGGVIISLETNNSTLLTGLVIDQAALHGLLKKVRDLGMPLISVMRLDPKQANRSGVNADINHNRSKKETNT